MNQSRPFFLLLPILFFTLAFAQVTNVQAAPPVSSRDFQRVVDRIVSANRLSVKPEVRFDPAVDRNLASIRYSPALNRSEIRVGPAHVGRWPLNSWAFILGHEIAHQVRGPGGHSPEEERACDLLGARFALAAGYDLEAHVRLALARPDHCASSHGCHRDRILTMARALGVRTPAPAPRPVRRPPVMGCPPPPFPPDSRRFHARGPVQVVRVIRVIRVIRVSRCP